MRTTYAMSLLGSVLFVEHAPTQEPAVVPPRLLLRLEVDGPATWRAKFGPTNVGVMLASEEGGRAWKPRLQPFDLALRRFLAGTADGPGDAAGRDRWVDYGGRMEFLLWTSEEKDPREAVVPHAAMRFHGDGRADLDALASDLTNILVRHGEKVGELQVNKPLRDGESVVVLLGGAATFANSDALVKALPPPAALGAKGPSLWFMAHGQDVGQSLRTLDAGAADTWNALGLAALQYVEFAVGTAGPLVQVECAMQFEGEERGLFRAFFPAAASLPPLLHLVPNDGMPWKAGHFDLAALWRTGCALADVIDEKPAGTADAAVAKGWGVDPLADVFAHVHTDYLLLGMPGWSSEDGFVVDGLIVFRLRDAAKFAAGFERMRKNWKPHVQKAKEEEHEGVVITHYSTMFLPLQMAVAHGNLFFAIGKGGAERIRAALDRCKLPAEATTGEAWASLRRHFPAGHNGVGEIDLHRVLTMHLSTFLAVLALLPQEGLPEFLRDVDPDAVAEELSPLLERHGLRTLRSATGYQGGRWNWRLFW